MYITFVANFAIGILVGITGISGFLLPLIYVGFLHLPLHDSLALSFIAFGITGLFGALSLWRNGHMNLSLFFWLSLSSLPGAYLGVWMNVLLPDWAAKILLYIFILCSGIFILLRRSSEQEQSSCTSISPLLSSKLFLLLLGFAVSSICALTGAGGPILLMPVLVNLGIPIRTALGVSLLNSVLIALPAIIGYLGQTQVSSLLPAIIQTTLGSTLGVFTGAYIAGKMKIVHLRTLIALVTILSSLYMLGKVSLQFF